MCKMDGGERAQRGGRERKIRKTMLFSGKGSIMEAERRYRPPNFQRAGGRTMNQTMETILTRRSIRSFQEKPIPEEDMKQIVDAALHAPSAMGRQTWKFTVVMNREKIQKLAKAVGKVLGREDYDMYRPEALVIPSNEKDSRFGRDDNACAWRIFSWPPILSALVPCGSTSFTGSVTSRRCGKF